MYQNKNVSHEKRGIARGWSKVEHAKHFQTNIDPIENPTYFDFIIADPSRWKANLSQLQHLLKQKEFKTMKKSNISNS